MGALFSHQIQHVQRIHRLHMPIGMRATMLIPVVSYYNVVNTIVLDFELKKVLPPPPPPLGNFADISYLEENFKPHLLRDVCTLCSGALVSDSLLHMLL